jgi:vacuolar-type H+-ATPase subunit I/STV1
MTILQQYKDLEKDYYEIENLLSLIDAFEKTNLNHFERFKARLKMYLELDFLSKAESMKNLEDQINGIVSPNSQEVDQVEELKTIIKAQTDQIKELEDVIKKADQIKSDNLGYKTANIPLVKSVEPTYPQVRNGVIDNTPINLNADHGEMPFTNTTFFM